MISYRITKRMVILIGIVLLLSIVPAAFSAQDDACPTLVQQALTDLGQNCDALDRNSACYGYNRVDATFTGDVQEGFFSTPADRAGLKNLATIETAPLSLDEDYWGIAVLNVQANVPNTLPGQAVTFILMGDVELDNDVDPNSVVEPGAPITIKTLTGANVRSSANARANLIGSVPVNTELSADGLSPDGSWVRILFSGGVGWITREVVEATDGDISALTTISSESRTPMQAFTFRTTPGGVSCSEQPPSLLVVQGPDNVKVDITANGADIRLGSTIALRILEGNQVQLMVVDGEAQLGNLKVPAGFTIFATLSPDGKTITGDWNHFRALSQDELNELQGLQELPTNLLHYPISVPTMEDIQEALDAFSDTSTTTTETGGTTTTTGVASGQVDCSPFKPTSPLDGLPFGGATFYWDAAPGATSYRLNLYGSDGGLGSSYEVSAPQTSVAGDTSNLGGGFMFSWDVQALVNGQVACTSGRVTLYREAPPPPPVIQPTPSFVCNFNETCETGESQTCADCWFSE